MSGRQVKPRPKLGDVTSEILDWAPHEYPGIPGTPSTPDMSATRRLAYGLIALLLGLTSGVGTALVGINLPILQGELGLDPQQGTWISVTYAIFSVSMNLLLIKYRQQFGLTNFAKVFVAVYAVAAVGHLLTGTFLGSLILRAISGVSGAALGSLGVMYMTQALPAKYRLVTIVLGIGAMGVSLPFVWMFSPHLATLGGWQGLYAVEAGLALASLAAIYALNPPPGIQVHSFEWKDFVSFGLLASGFGLVVAAAAQGRSHWWIDAPWIGWALAGGVVLIVAGAVFEHYRTNPLVDTRWFLSFGFLNFAVTILIIRMLLSEQPFGSTGLLTTLGFGPEQFFDLYAVVLVGAVLGVLVSAWLVNLSPMTVMLQIPLSLACIAIGAFIDAHASAATHPSNLYFSQFLLGFASSMFIGAAVIFGIFQLMQRGLGSVITFAVAVGVSQTLGGQVGAALLSTFQAMRAQHHLAYLTEGLVAADPQTASMLQMYGGAYGAAIADPALRQAQGLSTFAQQVIQQANILAFNDAFWLLGWASVALLVVNVLTIAHMAVQSRKQKAAQSSQGAGQAAGAVAL